MRVHEIELPNPKAVLRVCSVLKAMTKGQPLPYRGKDYYLAQTFDGTFELVTTISTMHFRDGKKGEWIDDAVVKANNSISMFAEMCMELPEEDYIAMIANNVLSETHHKSPGSKKRDV